MDEEDFFNSPLYKSTRINRHLKEKLDHVRDSREKTVRRDELTVKSLVFEFPAAEKTIGFRDDLSSSSLAFKNEQIEFCYFFSCPPCFRGLLLSLTSFLCLKIEHRAISRFRKMNFSLYWKTLNYPATVVKWQRRGIIKRAFIVAQFMCSLITSVCNFLLTFPPKRKHFFAPFPFSRAL